LNDIPAIVFIFIFGLWGTTFGGMGLLPQHRDGMRFCRQTAVYRCAFRYKVIALAKTMTPGGGPRLQPG